MENTDHKLAQELLSAAIMLLFNDWGTTDPERLKAMYAGPAVIDAAELIARAQCELRDPRD